MRTFTAALMTPALKLTGFRFSKEYRQGATATHRLVYWLVDVVQANVWAAG
jgi:hypothetical protein